MEEAQYVLTSWDFVPSFHSFLVVLANIKFKARKIRLEGLASDAWSNVIWKSL
jgi:hypothetical protein